MAQFIERYDLATTVEEMATAFRPTYLAAYQVEPDVIDGLRRLRAEGWSLGIVTNGPPSQGEKVTATGLDQLVDGWAVSEVVGFRKPDPRVFEAAAAECGATLDGAWMVGDSAPADMAGAHNTGLRSIWLDRGRSWSDVAGLTDPFETTHGLASSRPADPFEPDHIVGHITDAMAIVGGW